MPYQANWNSPNPTNEHILCVDAVCKWTLNLSPWNFIIIIIDCIQRQIRNTKIMDNWKFLIENLLTSQIQNQAHNFFGTNETNIHLKRYVYNLLLPNKWTYRRMNEWRYHIGYVPSIFERKLYTVYGRLPNISHIMIMHTMRSYKLQRQVSYWIYTIIIVQNSALGFSLVLIYSHADFNRMISRIFEPSFLW